MTTSDTSAKVSEQRSLTAQQRPSSFQLVDPENFGLQWRQETRALVDGLPVGTTVIVSVGSGQHVTAHTGLAAMELFRQRFGDRAVGWMFEVGVPITLGGGLCQLRSDTSTIDGEP